jgi:short-subunit dehydrogenase
MRSGSIVYLDSWTFAPAETRSGLRDWSRAANELRGQNITVNVVAPGPVAAELFLVARPRNKSYNSASDRVLTCHTGSITPGSISS